MEDGQLWFDFAWAAAWAGRCGSTGPERADGDKKIFFSGGAALSTQHSALSPEVARPVGLCRVISIDPAGAITHHWQTRRLSEALGLASWLARRLPGEAVRVRRTIELVRTIELDEQVTLIAEC